jgi:hypothetical protein
MEIRMEKKISAQDTCGGSVSHARTAPSTGKTMRFKQTILALILAALPLSTPAFADKAMLVLDASGSMNAQIGGKSKLRIAREVVDGLVDGWPQATELGMIAYGHREKDNCGDIQTLVKPASGSWPAIKAAVGDIAAKGKTPITEAVRAAAKELNSEEGKATVILVSDGLETCNADPCAAAAELEKAGVDFTVHVVGFGTTAEENRQLQCIADKTGGRFLGASNASELKTAMTKTVELVAKPEPPKQNVISFKKAILKLDNAHNSQFVYESSGNRINSVPIKDEMQLSPGRYSLQDSRHNHTSANFEIKAGENLNINQIAGSLVLKNAPRSQYIYNEAGNDRLNSVPFDEAVHLPPGRYKLTDGSTSQLSEAFEVKVGEETVIDFNQ